MHSTTAPPLIVDFIPLLLLAALVVISLFFMRRRGYGSIGGDNVIVRCRAGHVFTTIWVPGVSFKAIRLGLVRFQYCPIGNHWAFIDIVNPTDLTDAERQFAMTHHDSRIP